MDHATVVEFFDPHSGLAGCPEPLPDLVKVVADRLDGTRGSIGDAVETFHAAYPDGIVSAHGPGSLFGRYYDFGYIALAGGREVASLVIASREFHWCVIKFRVPKHSEITT